jgi:hypothetical protein
LHVALLEAVKSRQTESLLASLLRHSWCCELQEDFVSLKIMDQ